MSDGLIGIIGGTGLGDALAENIVQGESCEVETPFGRPSAKIMVGRLGENKIAFLSRHGEGHKLSPSEVPFAANIFALKELGVHTVLSSAAVGSLREEMAPGDLVVVEQFIDKTFKRQNTFFENFAAVHCEMAEPVCGRLRDTLLETAKQTNVKVHSGGTYVCIEGPQFSTRAESLMHQAWGGDLVGMTAMPEAKLAREAQMCYALIALVSDYDCWSAPGGHKEQENRQTLLAEIMANLQTATNNCLELIKAVLTGGRELVREDCRCRKSLDLAVWTDQGRIEPAEKERLKVLFE
ncbi:S-methyl-5'-thioadenosine phosphorylase [subsurface metagenome]